MMFSIGLKTPYRDFISFFDRRSFILRAALANLIIVPLIAILIAALLPLSIEGRIGLILLSVMPGALLGLQFTAASAQSRSSAAILTFLLSLFAIAISPWYARTLALSSGMRFEIPFARLSMALLLYLALPLAVGLVLHRWLGSKPKLLKIIDLLSRLSFLGLFIASFEAKSSAVKNLEPADILSLVALLAGSFLAGLILGRTFEEKRFFAAITSMRNVAVALAVAYASFPERNVDLIIIAYSALMLPPNAVMLFLQRRQTRKQIAGSKFAD